MTSSSDRRTVRAAELALTSVAAVSWAFLAMAAVAALGLKLLGADGTGRLGPMTAAAVVLAVGGSVTPSGDLKAFGLEGAQARTAIDIAPLGVSLVGALVLGWIFLRSLRAAGRTIRGTELAARVATVAALFLVLLGVLTWAGSDTITIDGSELGLDKIGGGRTGVEIPGVGDLGDLGGRLTNGLADLANAKAAVGFSVRTGASLLGGALWVLAVLLIAVLTSRGTPLPRGWEALHRTVRPAASALRAALVLAVCAGLAAAVYAAIGDDHPRRVLGSAVLAAPNGVWLGLPIGLFVPWHGRAGGALVRLLPDPLDKLLGSKTDEAVTVGRLAELDGRVWLLVLACVLTMLATGLLAAARTPRNGLKPLAYAGRLAVWLGAVTALTLPLLVWLTRVKADASLSVLGFDAFGAGLDLHGHALAALLLGAAWGAAAGAFGGLLACATGAAGRRAAPYARGRGGDGPGLDHSRTYPNLAYEPGPYNPSPAYRPLDETNPYLRPAQDDPYTTPTRTAAPKPPHADALRERTRLPRHHRLRHRAARRDLGLGAEGGVASRPPTAALGSAPGRKGRARWADRRSARRLPPRWPGAATACGSRQYRRYQHRHRYGHRSTRRSLSFGAESGRGGPAAGGGSGSRSRPVDPGAVTRGTNTGRAPVRPGQAGASGLRAGRVVRARRWRLWTRFPAGKGRFAEPAGRRTTGGRAPGTRTRMGCVPAASARRHDSLRLTTTPAVSHRHRSAGRARASGLRRGRRPGPRLRLLEPTPDRKGAVRRLTKRFPPGRPGAATACGSRRRQ
ncbi:streptophobe family protein [Streptomyces sp. NPDC050610]|uniref:streptophobe family protein n=1 Tax=Streptomyces sp. NPDC050610 TaxID=3157097 RepID=UPI00343FCEC0